MHVVRKYDSPSNRLQSVLFVESVEKQSGDEEVRITDEDIQEFKLFAQPVQNDENNKEISVIERLVSKAAPLTIDNDLAKKALLIVAVNAGLSNDKTRLPRRIRSHAGLIGDPGLAKTQLLHQIAELVPGSRAESMQSGTPVSMTVYLDKDTFCKSLGLVPEEVKFIQVGSDFPTQNRPIYPMNIAHLNSNSLQQQDIQIKIARAIDNLMILHKNHKGIIHTTSYKQVNFIIENISQPNRCRLLKTDPDIPREEVIAEHIHSTKPTALISPSLYWGLDLKDDLSRFQIITKVPYPDLGDRWISKKKEMNRQWYIWQTALRLVQGYGRSIRSKEDWAKTYVLNTGFVNFVKTNSNIIPDWFTKAIRSISYDLLKAPI